MLVLTKKQKDDLNRAVIQYLTRQCQTSAAAFAQTLAMQIPQEKDEGPSMLQRKWTTIIRLQNRVTQLEKQITTLKEELNKRGLDKRNTELSQGQQHFLKVPERMVLKGHRSNITNIDFHPQYTQAATCSQDGTIKIWDFDTGQLQRTLTGHTGSVNQANYDTSGKFIASCSADCSIKIWDCVNDFACIRTLVGHDHNVSSVAFSPLGDFIISASRDCSIRLWDIPSGYLNKKTFNGHDQWVKKAIISSNGKIIVSCSKNEFIMVWHVDKDSPQQIIKTHQNSIQNIILVQGDKALYLLQNSELFKKRKQQLKKQEMPKQLFIISSSRDKTIRLFSAITGINIHVFHGHDNWIKGIDLHPTGKWMFSSSDDKTVRVWDMINGKCLKKTDAHQHFISCLKLSTKYRVILTGGADHLLKLWHLC